jgi:phage terminase Nu1 subunit (DNA packaging protein)
VGQVDLSKPITQVQFGELVGVSQQAVSEFVKVAALGPGVTAGEMLQAYCHRLREVAAGRGWVEGAGGLDLAQERAALAREQRMGHEIKNAVARREFASVLLLARTLATASQAVVERFEQLPAALARECPELPDAARTAVMRTIAAARNEWTARTIRLVTEDLTAAAGDDESLEVEGIEP